MHLAGVGQHVLDAVLDRHVDEARHLAVAIEAEQHALVAEVAPRRIREVAERQVRVEVTAEDLVVLLPEPPLHLQPHLRARAVRRGLHRRHRLRRQVDVEAAQDRQRQARHAVVGRDFRHRAGLGVLVGHLHAVGRLANRDDLGAERDLVAELPLKAFRELVHAADRLEHRRHVPCLR